MSSSYWRRRLPAASRMAVCAAAALQVGCASFSPDGGFAPVQQAAQERLGKDLRWARTEADQQALQQRVAELQAQPLTADAAVQIALLNNRGLQAGFQELGITEAEFVQAGRLPNPGFSFGRLRRGDEVEREFGLHLNLARLALMPMARELEARRFDATQRLVAMQVLALAAETRKAWVLAVAAEETVRYARQVLQAAEVGAELARRMEQQGNFNKLQRAREQSFEADAALGLVRAEQAQRARRERLTRLLGLDGAQAPYTLPERLPDLPAELAQRPDVERQALAQRLDVQGARLAAEQTARNLGLTKATRFVNVLELGLLHNRSNEAPTQRGWEIGVELPLFDWGGARVARAEAVYMQAVHRAAEVAINARSEVREAHAAWRSAYHIARQHQDRLVPLRQEIAQENLLRYNGMLIGVFELLADARAQIAGVNAAIEARRDFWLAEADLDLALIGKPSLTPTAGPALATESSAGAAH
jgi:outer membrane protein TolC